MRNWILQIRRDSKGYLWFCTAEGISLFDGYRFTNYGTRDGLPNRQVSDMAETRDGEYWFATGAGLAHFRPKHVGGAAFETVRVGKTKDSNAVNALYVDAHGTVWCATDAGLYTFSYHSRNEAPQPALAGLEDLRISSITPDSKGNLWLCTPEGPMLRHPGGAVERIHATGAVDWIAADRKGRLWAGGNGLFRVRADAEPPVMTALEDAPISIAKDWITRLYADEDGAIWIGGRATLARFVPDASIGKRFTIYAAPSTFGAYDVLALAQDAQGNLWLGSNTLGAVRVLTKEFAMFTEEDGLASRGVVGFTESADGRLYAITRTTLNELREDRFIPRPLATDPKDWPWWQGRIALQDREHEWWFGTLRGLARYGAGGAEQLRGKRPKHLYDMRDGFPEPAVLQVFEDSRGDIWAGTYSGVARWNRAADTWQGFSAATLTGDPSRMLTVHSFEEDKTGAVWAGFHQGGLARFVNGAVKIFTSEVPRGGVNALLCDRRGRLWIGSSQGGLGRVDDPSAEKLQVMKYGLDRGLASEHVFSLAEDRWGRIYVAAGRGVDRLDPDSGNIRHFNASSGLPPGETQVVYCDRRGDIWFASLFGVSRYHPEMEARTIPPAPLIRGLRIEGALDPVSELGERKVTGPDLPPGQNNVEIEFRALDFDTGERLRYQYRLEGADKDWSAPDNSQTVRYANLAPGRYRFAARSVSEAGDVSTAQAEVSFRVPPAVWQRSWFVALAMASAIAGGVLLHRYRLNQLLALERVRTGLTTDLHDGLGAGLAEIAILSEAAKCQQAPRTVELLDRVAVRARELRASMTDLVWTVDPREDCLANLVIRMRQTAFTLLEGDGRRVEFRSPAAGQLDREISPEMKRHIMLFFKEAITNVARHSNASAAEVTIDTLGGQFRLGIRDNGCGFDAGNHQPGQGLRSLRHRARELRADLRLESSPEGGTEIQLSVPL